MDGWLFVRYLVIGLYVGLATVGGFAWWFLQFSVRLLPSGVLMHACQGEAACCCTFYLFPHVLGASRMQSLLPGASVQGADTYTGQVAWADTAAALSGTACWLYAASAASRLLLGMPCQPTPHFACREAHASAGTS